MFSEKFVHVYWSQNKFVVFPTLTTLKVVKGYALYKSQIYFGFSITSDHGFIYQNRPIEESDYTKAEPAGETILFRDRRFILGNGLKENNSLKKYTATELGLCGNME